MSRQDPALQEAVEQEFLLYCISADDQPVPGLIGTFLDYFVAKPGSMRCDEWRTFPQKAKIHLLQAAMLRAGDDSSLENKAWSNFIIEICKADYLSANIIDQDGRGLINLAIELANPQLAKYLATFCDREVLRISDKQYGRTPMHWAAALGCDIIECFSQRNVVIGHIMTKEPDANDDTPFHLAAKEGHEEIFFKLVDALLKGQKDQKDQKNFVLVMQNKQGRTPLQLAQESGVNIDAWLERLEKVATPNSNPEKASLADKRTSRSKGAAQ